MPRRKPGTLLPLETEILELALAMRRSGHASFHGFGLAQAMREHNGSRALTGHGTLYKALGRLEEFGLLASRWEDAAAAEVAPAGVTMGCEPVSGVNQFGFSGAPLTGAVSSTATDSGSGSGSGTGSGSGSGVGAAVGWADTGTGEIPPRPLIDSSQPSPCSSSSAEGAGAASGSGAAVRAHADSAQFASGLSG